MPAFAATAQDGLAAYKAGRYARAVKILQPLARKDDAQAQYLLGVLRERGQGVPRDHARAAYWYARAITSGEVPAAYWRLGLLYRDGRGVARDLERAGNLLDTAAARGSKEGARDLRALRGTEGQLRAGAAKPAAASAPRQTPAHAATAEAGGANVPQEMGTRVAKFQAAVRDAPRDEAARQGLADAAVTTAELALAAEALEEAERVAALREFTVAQFGETPWRLGQMAKRGNAAAQATLGLWHDWGVVVARDAVLACQAFVEAAALGHAAAQYRAALCLTGAQPEDARRWLLAAARAGHAGAQELAARACLEGKERDLECARRWLEPAARAGRPGAMVLLGWTLSAGGDERGAKDALRWYALAANRGNLVAQNNLGECYERGKGIETDPAKAISWYRRAAEAGLAAAQYNLGRMLRAGEGGPRDPQAAREWLIRAAEGGVAQARHLLAEGSPPP
ncbi:MAG: sel1 repeat family protein [Betaproteobacteria bacterium]|nr:sel1 repeat family protein [Betaproteobacteria bacterium]